MSTSTSRSSTTLESKRSKSTNAGEMVHVHPFSLVVSFLFSPHYHTFPLTARMLQMKPRGALPRR